MERAKKERSLKKLFNRSLTYFVLLFGIFALCYSTSLIIKYVSLNQENKELQSALNELKENNTKLEILNEKLKDSDYFSVYVKDKYQYSSNNNTIIPID